MAGGAGREDVGSGKASLSDGFACTEVKERVTQEPVQLKIPKVLAEFAVSVKITGILDGEKMDWPDNALCHFIIVRAVGYFIAFQVGMISHGSNQI